MILWLACTGADPQLDPLKEALTAYDEGRAALDAGQTEAAVDAMTRATESDPRSPELWLWLGKAHADDGDLIAAIRAADKALGLDPDLLEARYDRACWKSRFGDLEGAAQDLSVAAQDARLDPFHVATDPDLDALRDDPTYGHVVAKPVLPTRVDGPSEPSFLGSEVVVTIGALHPDALTAEFVLAGPPPGLELRRVVEDHVVEGPMQRTELATTWVVRAAGETQVGPWTVRAGDFTGVGDPVRFELLAPEGHVGEPGAAGLIVPSAVRVERAERQGQQVTAWGEPGDTLSWQATDVVKLELRERGQPVAVGWRGTLAQGESVTLMRGRTEVWSVTP